MASPHIVVLETIQLCTQFVCSNCNISLDLASQIISMESGAVRWMGMVNVNGMITVGEGVGVVLENGAG